MVYLVARYHASVQGVSDSFPVVMDTPTVVLVLE